MHTAEIVNWNQDYLNGNTPWETDCPSPELVACVEGGTISRGQALEMGCGTGQNAVFLAKRGFRVTAVDCSQVALSRASRLADSEHVCVRLLDADVCRPLTDVDVVDFVLDRSCYEFLRDSPADRQGYLTTLNSITRVGSKFLLILRQTRKERLQGVQTSELFSELGRDWVQEQAVDSNSRFDCKHPARSAFLLSRTNAS